MRDGEIVASIVGGDPDGLAAAYDRYADPLYTYCRSMLRDPADAADAVQDTFVIAASRLDGLRDPERLRSWLYAVARNESLRILRGKKVTSGLDEAADVTDESVDVSATAERSDLRALLREASEGLNPGEREVIELQLGQGLEAAEVATVLGVSRNHAHSLLSRARDQLEACLGVLLVGRAGREDCQELGGMLSGWDGRLTVLLRKRLNRHIEHCDTCTGRKALVLRPAAFLGLAPLTALAGAAAEGIRLAPGAPAALKAHVLTLATSTGPSAAAHRAAVLSRAGSFAKSGFPKPAAAKAGVLHGVLHGSGGAKGSFLKSPQGQAAAAGVVLAVAAASVAFALTASNGPEHLALSGTKPSHSSSSGGSGGGGGAAAPPPRSHKSKPKPPPVTHPAPVSQPTVNAAPPPAPAPTSAPPAPPPRRTPTSPAAPPPTTPATSASPSVSPSSPPPPGTLAAAPAGGFITIPPGGATITLTAQGGPVNWNIAVSGGAGTVTAAPASGTLKSGQSAAVTVTSSTVAAGQTLTVSPGGVTYVVLVGWGRQPGSPGPLPSFPAVSFPAVSFPPGLVPPASVTAAPVPPGIASLPPGRLLSELP